MKIKMRSPLRNILLSVLAVTAFGVGHLNVAGQGVTSATLSGIVEDANGAYVPGATLTATNVDTNQQRTTDSDREGRFAFAYLHVGNYRVTIAESGFHTLSRNLTLTLGQALYFV